MITLYFVRHGQTVWNESGRYQGSTEVALSALGKEQAKLTAHWFEEIFLNGDLACAVGRRLRQVRFAQRQGAHAARGLLPALIEVQKGDGVEAHVAVVRDGEREADMAVGDEIVVPFLDAHGAGLDIRAAVDGQERAGPAGLEQIAVLAEQRRRGGDFMLLSHVDASCKT